MALVASHLNTRINHPGGDSVALGIATPPRPPYLYRNNSAVSKSNKTKCREDDLAHFLRNNHEFDKKFNDKFNAPDASVCLN